MTTDEIAASITTRLEALARDIEQLTAARDALLHEGQTPRKPEFKPSRRRARRGRRRRTPVSPETAMQFLSANGGTNAASMAREAHANPQQVLAVLRELEAAGQVRRAGQGRGTLWHAVTDEDRIEARAAELASRSRSR